MPLKYYKTYCSINYKRLLKKFLNSNCSFFEKKSCQVKIWAIPLKNDLI